MRRPFVQTGRVQVDVVRDVPRLVAVPSTARLGSLDAFRGLTMAGMVIVNNPGTWNAIYWPLDHAEWNGWTPTDLIFPFFLFIVGISLTLSRRTLSAPASRIVIRAFVIVGCGLFLAGFPFFNPAHWRIPGVLQRIGVCYLAAALLYRWTAGRRQVAVLVAVTAALLVIHSLALTRLGDLSEDGNIGAVVDRAVFGNHLWRPRWDPEGLFSTITAVATTILGVLTGIFLRRSSSSRTPGVPGRTHAMQRQVNALTVAGVALFAAGEAWGAVLPINKSLWTSSYVLLTAGAAALILAGCLFLIDIRHARAWSQPFVILGQNALTLFVASGLIGRLVMVIDVGGKPLQAAIFDGGFALIGSPKVASLAYALVFLAVMYALCDVMYRRGIFIRA